jgi:hypothetical protein
MKAFYSREDPHSNNSHTHTACPHVRAWDGGSDLPEPRREPHTLCTQTREQAILHGLDLIHELTVSLRQGEVSTFAAIWEALSFDVNVVATADIALAKAAPPPPLQAAEPAVLDFPASSLFLANCHAYLTSHPKLWERMFLVTGQKLSPTRRTLALMSKVALSEQSSVGAVADPVAIKQALSAMGSWGHALHGLFHSHPGLGVLATRPSSTDLDTHERYERGGVPLVGCIFVRDGTLRFFRYSPDPFTITISGTGIVPINEAEHVYKIENPGAARLVSFEAFTAED